MNNNVKMKNKDDIFRYTKLSNQISNKHNHAKKSNLIQIYFMIYIN